MKAVVSFCNNIGNKENSNLLLLDVFSGEKKWIPFNSENTGFRGISQDKEFVYALYHAENSGILILDKKTLKLIIKQELSEVKDSHSMIVDGEYIYIVSTGTDQIIKYKFDKKVNSVDYADVFWSPIGSLQNSDTHHLNSLFKNGKDIFVSGFGLKENELWSSASNGYVQNLRTNQKVIENIHHPHSVFVLDEDVYYCESSTKRVKLNDRTIVQLDCGYTRGLSVDNEYLLLGTNSGRKTPKGDGFVANPADPGQIILDCKVLVYQKPRISENFKLAKSFDFLPEHKEIYDIMIIK